MIQIEHLSVAYQQTLALEDLSLTIQSNHPRHSWTQRSRKVNPDQGHARTSPSCGKGPARSKRPRPSSSTSGLRRTEIRY